MISEFGQPVYSQSGLSIFFVGGQTWNLSPQELFSTWYQVRSSGDADTAKIERLDCPIGSLDNLGEPLDSFNVQARDTVRETWKFHSDAVFGTDTQLECPEGTTGRVHTLDLRLLQATNQDDPCVYARFNGTQNLEYSRENEDWCIVTESPPLSASPQNLSGDESTAETLVAEDEFIQGGRCAEALEVLSEAEAILRRRENSLLDDVSGRLDRMSSEAKVFAFELPFGSELRFNIIKAANTFAWNNTFSGALGHEILEYLEPPLGEIREMCAESRAA